MTYYTIMKKEYKQQLPAAVWMNLTNRMLTKKQVKGCNLHKIQKHVK